MSMVKPRWPWTTWMLYHSWPENHPQSKFRLKIWSLRFRRLSQKLSTLTKCLISRVTRSSSTLMYRIWSAKWLRVRKLIFLHMDRLVPEKLIPCRVTLELIRVLFLERFSKYLTQFNLTRNVGLSAKRLLLVLAALRFTLIQSEIFSLLNRQISTFKMERNSKLKA